MKDDKLTELEEPGPELKAFLFQCKEHPHLTATSSSGSLHPRQNKNSREISEVFPWRRNITPTGAGNGQA